MYIQKLNVGQVSNAVSTEQKYNVNLQGNSRCHWNVGKGRGR